LIVSETLSEQVRKHLKKQLEKGVLRPGDKIDEKNIAKNLKISRTPIREALIQLEREGFIEIFPRRCIRVKKLSLNEIKDIYAAIGSLEGEAAAIAIDKFTEEDISKMEELYYGMEKALVKDNFIKYMELNLQSHSLFIKKCENEIFSNIIGHLKKRLYDFPRIIVTIPEWEKMLMKDHYNLIQLFKKKDKDAIRKLIKEKHWNFERNYPFIIQKYGKIIKIDD
jgi:DNA-binding GntR family transcriptional regulator